MEQITKARAGPTGLSKAASVGPYVLDFYCAPAQLAIEIDGISHDMGKNPQRDLERDDWLKAQDIELVRIAASDISRKFDDLADAIMQMALEKR